MELSSGGAPASWETNNQPDVEDGTGGDDDDELSKSNSDGSEDEDNDESGRDVVVGSVLRAPASSCSMLE